MKRSRSAKSGNALLTILGLMAVLSVSFGMLLTNSSQSVFTTKRMVDRTKAVAYAEAGIEFAYTVLRANYENRNNPGLFRLDTSTTYTPGAALESGYGDGSFTLTLIPSSNGQYVVVNSVGKCGTTDGVEVEVLVEDTAWQPPTPGLLPPPDYNDYDVFNKALASGSSATFAGGGKILAPGTQFVMHSNNALAIKGSVAVQCSVSSSTSIDIANNQSVAGTATAPSVTTGKKGGATGGKVIAQVPNVSIPDATVMLLENYRTHAENNGAFVSGNASLSSNPPGGVWYVDGDVTIPPGASITATIIATGNIDVKGDVVATHGIVVGTVNGNITYTSQANTTGLVYSQTGTFTQVGGGSSGVITGQIIAGGEVNKAGGGDLIFGKFLPIPPEDGITTPPTPNPAQPQIAAWQK